MQGTTGSHYSLLTRAPSRHKLSLSDSRFNGPSGTSAHVSGTEMLFVRAARNQAQVLPSG